MNLSMLFSFKTWISRLGRLRRRPLRKAPLVLRRTFRPALEFLEDRVTPATGTLTYNSLNQATTLSVYRDNGQGTSGWLNNTSAGLANLTYTDAAGVASTVNTFCVDLVRFASAGQSWSVDLRDTLTTSYANGSQMAYVFARYGQGSLTTNQVCALQVALWDLSLSNHTPTQFVFNSGTGNYDSGDSVFQVNFLGNAQASAIAGLVNTYLASAAGAPAGSFFDGAAANKQSFIVPPATPPALPPVCTTCPPPPVGNLVDTAPGLAGAAAGASAAFSDNPVRYGDGVVRLAWQDLGSDGFGTSWGQTRNWTNGAGYADGGLNGSGTVTTQQPHLLQVGSTIAVLTSGNDAYYFDLVGSSYVPRFFDQNTLAYNSGTGKFTFTDTTGNQLQFWDFSTSRPVLQRGGFQSYADAAGNLTQVTARTADGKIAEVQRSQTVGGSTHVESYLYSYVASGVNAGRLASVTLRRNVNAGAWTTVRQVDYAYYVNSDAFGSDGDLKTATLKDGAGAVLDTLYYRYYEGEAGGYVHALKYAFGAASFARLDAAFADPFATTDAQADDYADFYFEFDAQKRVKKETVQGEGCSVCSGGQGTYTFSYSTSGFSPGFNTWTTKTVETLPDNNQNIVYTNAYGQVVLSVFKEGANEWKTYYEYDSAGRLVLTAAPSAVSGYSETLADLVGKVSATDYTHLNGTGLITTATYYASTSATISETVAGGVAGYVQDVFIRRGEAGTPVPQGRTEYYARTANGVTVYPVATQTDYRTVDGTLDTSFDFDGQVTTGFGAFPDAARAVVLLGDRLVSAGEAWNGTDYDFALTRYNSDGSLDASFGQGGVVRTGIGTSDDFITAIAVVNNQLVVAGYSWNGTNYDFALARYNANGTLDTTFGSGGKLTTAFGTSDDLATGVAAYANQLVVSGYTWNGTNYDVALARYNANGTLDTTFDADGKVTTAVGAGNDYGNAVAVSGTQIVVAGATVNGATTDVAVLRYNANGSLDTSFDGDGKAITAVGASEDAAYSLALDGSKLVVAGATINGATIDVAVLRYNSNGTLDTTFDTDGKVVTAVSTGNDSGNAVAVVNGQVVVVGGTGAGDFLAVRYNNNGSLDTSFDGDGKLTTDLGSTTDQAYGLALQADGKLVAAGQSNGDFALARYNVNGSLDTSFDGDGKLSTGVGSSLDVARAVALYGASQVVTAGWAYTGSSYDFALARYNADGSLDTTFGSGGKVTTAFGSGNDHATALLVVGTQLVVAGYTWNGSNYDFALARYNANGSLDTTFGTGGKVTTAIGASDDLLTGLALDGTKLVVAGYSWNGANYDFAVARYNANGTLDTSFDGDGKATTAVGTGNDYGNSVAVSGGQIIVAGSTVVGTTGDIAVVRYNNNGTLDASFDGDGKAITPVGTGDDAGYSVAVAGTQLLISGTTVNGTATDFALLRYNSNGSLDTAFDTDGKVVTSLSAGNDFGYAVTTAGSQIVVVGAASGDFAVARYNPNGSLDTSFDGDGKLTTDFGSASDQAFGVAIKADGQIIAAGTAGGEFTLARYNAVQTTSYSYTWFAGTTQVQSVTVSLPVVTAAQNGPGTAAVSTVYFDTYGRAVYTRDAEGFITKYEYDAATSALTKIIEDVQTTLVSDEPAGWVTPVGGGLHLTTTFEVDALGRTTKLTRPAGNVTYTTYNDAAHEARVYDGWTGSTTTGPTVVYREDRAGSYFETLTMSATPAVGGGRPTGTEAIGNVQTLARSYVSAGGQVTSSREYFNLGGLAYSTAANLGTLNTHFYLTSYDYDSRGRANKTVSPTGTIYRTVYDGLGRVSSTWVGLDDVPTTGFWSPTNNAGADMVQTAAYVYDGGGIGDSNLTQVTEFPGGGAANRVTQYGYDWRDRLVAAKVGVEGSESTTLNRPIYVFEYDNLDELIASEQYDGDGLSITTDANGDGVPDKPTAAARRARVVNNFDALGRVFRTQVYSVDQATGALSSSTLNTDFFFDQRGNLVKSAAPGGLVSKAAFDGAGRLKKVYTTDGGGDTNWAQALNVTGDNVLEQAEYQYDANSNLIFAIVKQHFHDDTATGELGTPTTGPKARVSYAAAYYDLADRLTATVNVGTNGGAAYTRPGTVPARSDTVLVNSFTYNAAGWVQDTTDPRGLVTRTLYDNLGRATRTIEGYIDGVASAGDDRTTDYTYNGNSDLLTVQAVLPGGAFQETKYVYNARIGTNSLVNSNDWLTATQHPDPTTGAASSSQQETYALNALGERTGFTDRNGTVHAYSYDVVGRLFRDAVTTLGAGVDGAVRRLETAFDTAGRAYLFTSYDAASGGNIVNQVQRAFNGLGQLVTEWQAHSGAVNTGTSPKVQYAYAALANGVNDSRLVSLTYPNGRVVSYDYGAAGGLNDRISRLENLKDGSTTLENYLYLGLNTVVQRSHPQPNVNLTYLKKSTEANGDAGDPYTGLDRFGRVVDQRWTSSDYAVTTDRFQYGYDRDGNVLYKDNLLNNNFDELYHANGATAGYDTLNRLTEFRRGALSDSNADGKPDTVTTATRSQNYALDAQGNMANVTTDGVGQARGHDKRNRITSIAGATTPTWDANGTLTTDETGRTLKYDAWNRLVEVKSSGGVVIAAYKTDALGRRIAQTISGTTTDLYYSAAWQVLEERVANVAKVQYVWSPVYIDAMVLRDRDADGNAGNGLEERLYVVQDANFNVTAVLSAAGAVLERYAQDPYGLRTILDAPWAVRANSLYVWLHNHQGLRFDPVTGLYWNRMRDYSPTLMRFVSNDKAMFDGTNLYSAYGNAPVNWVDPDGLARKKFFIVFVNDEKTGAAYLWHLAGTSLGTLVEWIPGTADSYTFNASSMQEAWEKMSSKLGPEDTIEYIQFAGHGSAGSWGGKKDETGGMSTVLDTEMLKNDANIRRILGEIRGRWDPNNKGVELRLCEQARQAAGKEFMKLLATQLNANVKGWDDWIEIWATGDEWTAKPGADIEKTTGWFKMTAYYRRFFYKHIRWGEPDNDIKTYSLYYRWRSGQTIIPYSKYADPSYWIGPYRE